MKKSIKLTIITLLCAIMCLPAVAYAWFSFVFPFADGEYDTGKLQPQTLLYFWDTDSVETDKWTLAPTAADASSIAYSPNFGTIESLEQMPANMGVYLKIRVNDTADVVYKWETIVTDIAIKVYDSTNTEVEATSNNNMGSIDYFKADGSQKCFFFAAATGANGLLPQAVTFGSPTRLSAKNQSLSGEYLPKTTWLYVHITFAHPENKPNIHPELVNILRCIPIEKSPYKVQFNLTIEGEGRTVE